jgi:hypothetical protein
VIRFRPSVEFACPFCELRVKAGEAVRPGDGEATPCVVHDEPVCKRFDELEPDEYMTAVNAKRAADKKSRVS